MTSSTGSAVVPAGYTAVEELGSGRFGRAVLCKDAADRTVVVRMSGITGERAASLEAELRSVAVAASHPCAVAIPKVWTDPTLGVCFEQGYCAGVVEAPVAAEAAAVGGVRLVAALAHAHRLGLLHGDLRPDDVMLSADGSWLLADGGVLDAVRRARPELAVDRDSLFSPRELRGWEPPAESADVYSLGATLRALLGDTPIEAGMDALLGRMVAPNPADRPSLVEVDEVLRAEVPSAAQAGLPGRPEGPRAAPVPPRPRIQVADAGVVPAAGADRRRMLVAAGAIGAVFVVAAGGVAIANSGSDHGGATAAAASSSLGATAGPTPSAVLNSAVLQPVMDLAKPDLDTDGLWKIYTEFSMAAVPSQVRGWRVFAVNPKNQAAVPQRYIPVKFPQPTSPRGPHGYRYGDWLNPGNPLNTCVRIETDTGGTYYQSRVKCPEAADVKKAEAAQAKAVAAAKKAAAKKAATKKKS
jgi:hypothetical protein